VIKAGQRRRSEPDWAALARELKCPGVNLMVLWEEYQQAHPQAYGYSRYVAAKFMLRRRGESQGYR
jgi:transposase